MWGKLRGTTVNHQCNIVCALLHQRTQNQISYCEDFLCFLKGKKTKVNQKKKALKTYILKIQKQSMFYFSFIFFSKENVNVVWFFNMCLQSYPKVLLKTKMQLLSQEFAPLYLNALIRTRDYRITLFYHNTRTKPVFFHISTLFVYRSICGKLTPHCP